MAKPSLFGEATMAVPHGVRQGLLCDWWLLAASSALAEDPDRI